MIAYLIGITIAIILGYYYGKYEATQQAIHTLKKLKEEIEDAIDVEIDINKCIRGKKTGVAECQIEEILEKLRPFDRNKVDKNTDITLSKLIDLGLSDNELRKEVCEKLNLGRCNCKLLLKRLTINNVQLEQLNAIIKECKNGNK